MSKNYGLTGIGGNVELAQDGPRIKDSSGAVEARNNADSAYAIMRVADGSAANDAVNKGQLDAATAVNSFATVAGDTGTATADSTMDTLTLTGGDGIDTAATDDPEVVTISVDVTDIIDTAAGLTEATNNIQVNLESDGGLQFDGTNHGVEIKPDATTGATVAPLTVGSNGAGVTVDNSTIKHTAGTLAAKDVMQYRKVDFAYDTSSPFNIGEAVPDGATVIGFMVQVDTIFDGTTPTLSIGHSGSVSAIAATTDIDLETAGLDVGDRWVEYPSSTQIIGTLTVSGASQGAGSVLIKYVL